MKKLVCLLLVGLMLVSLSACGGSEYSDDSYKNKTWDQMDGYEKEQTRQDISGLIDKSKRAGAEW